MFLKETTETKTYTRKSKFGKLNNYQRTKTLIHWQCDNCNKEFTKARNGTYDNTAKSYCGTCISKIGKNKLASIAGFQSKVKNKFTPNIGKVVVGKEGYPEIYIGKDYPYRKGGYRSIREHLYVMECYLERGLRSGEVVHHIDGDKTNNNIDNLYLTSVAEHNKLHAESESIVFALLKKGIVIFNKDSGRYELTEKVSEFENKT